MGYPSSRLARVLGLALVTPTLLVACATNSAGQPPVAPVAVVTAPANQATINGTITYSGHVITRNQVNVLPKIAGQITALNVDVGKSVKTGDVIAEIDHAALDSQVAEAQAALAGATARLATIQAGPRSENVAQAQANLEAAQARLTYMQQGGRPENVTAAAANVDAAAAKLKSLEAGRTDSVTQAQASLQAAQSRLQQLKNGPTQDQIRQTELGVELAKDAANAANVQKDAACNPQYPAAGCQAAQAAAFSASTGVNQAQAALKTLTAPPTKEQLDQAQAAVDAAQAGLQMAQHPGSVNDIAAAQSQVVASQAQLDLAKTPYTSADLATAKAAVDVAQQQLKLAKDPYTQQDTEAASAAVQQAQAALEMAQVTRADAIIKSPINGIVTQRFLTVGNMASPQSPIVALIDPNVDVSVNVDQNHIANLRNGESATITADALPGTVITGTISAISPAIDPQTGTFQVKITPKNQDAGLKDGMLAQVAFVLASHNNAMVVPANAIVQRNGQPTVFVVANNTATPHVVQTGLTDGTNTEIVSGIKVGELVVVSGQDRLNGTEPVTVSK